jgi:hypothetical protein
MAENIIMIRNARRKSGAVGHPHRVDALKQSGVLLFWVKIVSISVSGSPLKITSQIYLFFNYFRHLYQPIMDSPEKIPGIVHSG